MKEINPSAATGMKLAPEAYHSALKAYQDPQFRAEAIRDLKPIARELDEAMYDLFEAIENGQRKHAQELLNALKAQEDPASSESKLGYLNAAYAQALIDTML